MELLEKPEAEENDENVDNHTNVSFTIKKWNNIDELIEALQEELSQNDNASSKIIP